MEKTKRIDINYEYNINKNVILDLHRLKIIINNENIKLETNQDTIRTGAYDGLQESITQLIDNKECSIIILNMQDLCINKTKDSFQLDSNIYKEIVCKNLNEFKNTVIDIINQYYSNEELVSNSFVCGDLENMLREEYYTKEDYKEIEHRYKIKLDIKDYQIDNILLDSQECEEL